MSDAGRDSVRDADVLIVGAGPVGMTLALALARAGVTSIVAERRGPDDPPPAKCNHVSARSMELFRRLGFADALRNTGLPADYPNDVSYRTTFTGRELTRIVIPCRRDRLTVTEGADAGWPTPEPPHRINQIFLEPVLQDLVEADDRIDLRFRTEFVSMVEADDAVVATLRDREGATAEVRARYLVGCDGGSSTVRKAIGARFEGDAVIQRCQSTYLRAPDLIARQSLTPAWATFSVNERRVGIVYAIDGVERWVVHNYLRDDEEDFDAVDRDWGIRTILGVGEDFEYETLAEEDWYGRRLVADQFRRGPAFLAGDAAHVWVPYAGYGMNAGLADIATLSWQLAAVVNGWAGEDLLDAYEAERRPITERVSWLVKAHNDAMASQRAAVPTGLEGEGSDADAAREEAGRRLYDLNVQQYCAAGLNFGYVYDESPIIAYDGAEAPPFTMGSFEASTVPGCRAPHVWLADGTSLYDVLGDGYTVVHFGAPEQAEVLAAAGSASGVPTTVVDATGLADPAYTTALVLVRPDQHVAWRGDKAPGDPAALFNQLTARWARESSGEDR